MSLVISRTMTTAALLTTLFPSLGHAFDRPLFEGGADAVYIPTCTTEVTPVVHSISMTTPDTGAFLSRGDIKYVSGDALDIALTIPNCTFLSDIHYAGRSLGTRPDPIEGIHTYYTILSDRQRTIRGVGLVRDVTVRLHFTNLGRGYSPEVQLTVASKVGMLSSVHPFTLAQVADVKGLLDIAITEAELRNAFVAGLYETFGDYNDQWVEQSDGSWVRVAYDVAYGDDMEFRVEDDGIHVSMAFKADLGSFNSNVESWCDPTVRLSGHFSLNKDAAGVYVVWEDGPHADFDFPLYCDAVLVTVGLMVQAGIWYIMEPSAANKFGEMIEDEIAGSFPDEARFAIQSVGTVDGAVVAIMNPTWATVTVDVPYDPVPIESPTNAGLALPPGERVALVGGGLVDVCRLGGDALPPACDVHSTGRAGLFNWSGNPPVPSPWELHNGQWAYFAPRAEARARMTGFTREADRLPVPEGNVGMLLARTGDLVSKGHIRAIGSPCAVVMPDSDPSWKPSLAFAVNDHLTGSTQSYGGGSYRVSVGIAVTPFEAEMIGELDNCPGYVAARRAPPVTSTTVDRVLGE